MLEKFSALITKIAKLLKPHKLWRRDNGCFFGMWGLFWSVFSLQLFLFNFYPFLQRYLQPHQKGWQLLTFNLCGMWHLTVLILLTLHLSVFVLPLSPFVLCLVFPCSPFSPLGFPPPFPFPYPFLFCHVFPLLQTFIPPFPFCPFRPISLSLATYVPVW